MKSFFTFGVLLLCLAATQTARAAEDRNEQIKAEMVENYLLWQEALKIADAERIISFESPDFTTIFQGGRVESQARLDEFLRKFMKIVTKVYDARAEIKKLTIEPHRVVILSERTWDWEWGDENDSTRGSGVLQSRDIWVNYGGAWMLKRVERLGTKSIAR